MRDHPQLFRAYIGISQVVDLPEIEKLLYTFARQAAEQNGNRVVQKELQKLGPPPFANVSELQTSQKWVNVVAPDTFAAISRARLRLVSFSPDYSLLDLNRMVCGANFPLSTSGENSLPSISCAWRRVSICRSIFSKPE